MFFFITPPQESDLSLQETNVLAYIGGFIVRKVRDKVCNTCKEKITSIICPDNESHQFLAAKNYSGVKEGLLVGSTVLTNLLKQLESEYRSIIDDVIPAPHVKASLAQSFLKIVPGCLKCDLCHLPSLIVHFMINIRLHHTIRQVNHMLRDQKERKNRKMLKFSHL